MDLAESGGEAERRLLARAKNLGVLDWGVWARGAVGSILRDATDRNVRCLVVDLGSLGTREEQALVAEAVLGRLWERRADRSPVLIVIDEAHNVCPADSDDPLMSLATEHAVRIAGEGRKFGLYLLVSTQRPQKVHENVLSQCDNLLLMRMNSAADVGFVGEVFSFVPQSLLGQATTFRQGEALAAGKISPHPVLLRFGARVSEEGGSDVPADWARGGEARRLPARNVRGQSPRLQRNAVSAFLGRPAMYSFQAVAAVRKRGFPARSCSGGSSPGASNTKMAS